MCYRVPSLRPNTAQKGNICVLDLINEVLLNTQFLFSRVVRTSLDPKVPVPAFC